jgi:hypothetical protein
MVKPAKLQAAINPNKLSRSKSKAVVKPTKIFVLKLAGKSKPKRKSKGKTLVGNAANLGLLRKVKSKSVLKNSRPIFTKLQERMKLQEDVYQLGNT